MFPKGFRPPNHFNRSLFSGNSDRCGRRKPKSLDAPPSSPAGVDVVTRSERAGHGMRQVQARTYFHRLRGCATFIGVPLADNHFPPLASSAGGALRKPAHAAQGAAFNNHALRLPPPWVQDSGRIQRSDSPFRPHHTKAPPRAMLVSL
jgi:hypothetical protein